MNDVWEGLGFEACASCDEVTRVMRASVPLIMWDVPSAAVLLAKSALQLVACLVCVLRLHPGWLLLVGVAVACES